MRVAVATPVDSETTRWVVTTELITEPSAAVEKEVNVLGTVDVANKADVTTVSEVRVERLMVSDPTTTMSDVEELDELDLEVVLEPSLFVGVADPLVVGDGAVDVCSDVAASDVGVVSWADVVGVVASVVGVVGAAVVVSSDEIGVVEDGLVVGSAEGVVDMVEDSCGVEDASLVEDVTPVPTTCRLGIMPSRMMSAPACAKKRENMVSCPRRNIRNSCP